MDAVNRDFAQLYAALGYTFHHSGLLQLALTHCSYTGEVAENNQRLEYLGDAILDFVISEVLFHDRSLDEGQMTRMRASIVCEKPLYLAAKKLGLGGYLLLGKGEEATGGREKVSILSDCMESVFAAIYLDGGFDAAKGCITTVLQSQIEEVLSGKDQDDFKTKLQHLVGAKYGVDPCYRLVDTQGPAHDRLFFMEVLVQEEAMGRGQGKSKKEAEQQAAKNAIGKYQEQS